MNERFLGKARRVRRTPYYECVEAAGVKAYTVYNRMLLPTLFRSLEEDYAHLKAAVQIWDVSCERQVEVRGPDAARLMQMLTPRDLSKMGDDQCLYIPTVDDTGGMLNDPVAIKLGPDRFWISIADSDLLFWVKGLALGMGLNVFVSEPEVFPLAVQGPKAEDLMVRVFGDEVREIGFFRYKRLPFLGKYLVISRSGYSKQGGFEIYVDGAGLAVPLWEALFEAGKDLDVHAGCPNMIERIEAGLLSYGSDMTRADTPLNCGLEKFCHLDRVSDCIGHAALAAEKARGPVREIRSLSISGPALGVCRDAWWMTDGNGNWAGQVTSAVWSPDFDTNVALGMLPNAFLAPDTVVTVDTPDGKRLATVREKSFI